MTQIIASLDTNPARTVTTADKLAKAIMMLRRSKRSVSCPQTKRPTVIASQKTPTATPDLAVEKPIVPVRKVDNQPQLPISAPVYNSTQRQIARKRPSPISDLKAFLLMGSVAESVGAPSGRKMTA